MSSVVLSKNVNSTLDGLNLKWAINGMGEIIENTLVYYKNCANADIQSLDIKPTDSTLNLMLESGKSYSFQLQLTYSCCYISLYLICSCHSFLYW